MNLQRQRTIRNPDHAANLSDLLRSKLMEREENQEKTFLDRRTVRLVCPDGVVDMDAEILLAAASTGRGNVFKHELITRFCTESQDLTAISLPDFGTPEVRALRSLLHLGRATVQGSEQHRALLVLISSLGFESVTATLERASDGPFKVPLPYDVRMRRRRKRVVEQPRVEAEEEKSESDRKSPKIKQSLQTQAKTWTRRRRYVCSNDSCSAAFGRVSDFSRHMADEHGVDKPFACHMCDMAYVNKVCTIIEVHCIL